MSTQTVEFRAVTGQTVTAKLFTAGNDTEVASVTATEETNRKGTYRAVFTSVAEGEYQLIALNPGSIPLASWWVTLTLTTATFGVYDKADTRDVFADTTNLKTRLPAALVSGRIDSSVGAYQSGLAPPTAAENGAAGWNRMLVDHTSTGSFGYVIGLLFGLIENVTGWRFTTKALEQAPGGSTTGSGARTVTVTVNDGSTALQNARVRMTEGANTYTALTNASGVATFNLDDATYTVAITKAGYSYAGTTLVVDGNETVTYSMSATSITPSNPNLVTGYYTCYSELGVVESGVTVTLQVDRVPSETGLALDSAVRTATSDSNGLAQFTNLVPGAWYKVRRGEGNYYTFQISASATGSVELNSIIGT